MKEIQLTREEVAQVDDDDFDFLMQWKWFVTESGYAGRQEKRFLGNRHTILMHRVVSNPSNGFIVDHIDGNKLNNQKNNLRNCSEVENCRNRKTHKNNTSGYKGVHYNKQSNKFQARIVYEGNRIHLGFFDNPESAAKAYDKKAKELFKEFAKTNF